MRLSVCPIMHLVRRFGRPLRRLRIAVALYRDAGLRYDVARAWRAAGRMA